MVATTDCEKSKPITGNKVSKPLMEKKRRARINQCLDQLKSLLESYYSSSIRKRKLEKADILELTVKHLRNLQKNQKCSSAACEFSDYHTGFRNCLAHVHQYLLLADTLKGSERWMLSQLSSQLSSSTMDSGPSPAENQDEARRLHPPVAASEHFTTAKCKSPAAGTARTLPEAGGNPSPGPKQAAEATSTYRNDEKTRSHKFHCRNVAANTQHSVWRPW